MAEGGSTGAARDKWFSKEPRERGWRDGNGGPGEGPARRVGRVKTGFWEGGMTGADEVGLRARGGSGREMEGVRGWSKQLHMVKASAQKEDTCRERERWKKIRRKKKKIRRKKKKSTGHKKQTCIS